MALGAILDPSIDVASPPSTADNEVLRAINPHFLIEEHPIDEHHTIRAIVVGAGISGITAAILLPTKVPNLDLVIYERNDDLFMKGGVWHTNLYPGVRCDVPAHAYQATFAPSTDWTEAYATGPEIQSYWRGVAEKFDTDEGVITDEANFLITATGHFSDPKLPQYPGIDKSEGHLRHTSNWDPKINPKGKRIVVIGNGDSIDHYARNKTRVAAPINGEDLADFVAKNIEDARSDTEKYLSFRKALEGKLFSRFGGVFKDGPQNAAAEDYVKELMRARLGANSELADEIIPEFPVGCRRLTPGPSYLEALTAENVNYITDRILEFTETGIRTVDVQVTTSHSALSSPLSTRDLTFKRLRGLAENRDSQTPIWGCLPQRFQTSLQYSDQMPQDQLTYVAKILRKFATQGLRTTAPSTAATRDFRAGIKGGRIHGLWPGSAAHVDLVRKDPRWEDFEYTYQNPQGNRFGWLGNGWTKKDVAAAHGETCLELDLTPWLEKGALSGDVDLRSYHEKWWVS
ncbi:hypothetical protein CSAL01_10548 [Colletotrichum salicis]|uniref:FAD dependent oxidoreductase n=1 Tax=Colletotrichum salicis TaxID=1209931 RepID=A0A135UWL0_9PEZI|nr:hypothetical protein CSAL01_10548 [Colletotrichum salicis]